MSYLLDTNIVSSALKQNTLILNKLESIKIQKLDIYISCITYFEIKRGLLAINAFGQEKRFYTLCKKFKILFLDNLIILEKAAEIHANLRLRGLPIQTEDVLIAATAITKNLTLVSNDSDLERVENLILQKWINI